MLTHWQYHNPSEPTEYFASDFGIVPWRERFKLPRPLFIVLADPNAPRLNVGPEITAEEFESLIRKVDPSNARYLGQRKKTTRKVRIEKNGHELVKLESNFRSALDLTLSPPKSVSILMLVVGDVRIAEAFQNACRATLKRVRVCAARRERKNGQHSVPTSWLAIILIHHVFARRLDPQLHAHALLLNVTWDGARWTALEAGDILIRAPFFAAVFEIELKRELFLLGYTIRNTDSAFEVDEVPEQAISALSAASVELDRKASTTEKLLSAHERKFYLLKARPEKNEPLDTEQIRQTWERKLGTTHLENLRGLVRAAEARKDFDPPEKERLDLSTRALSQVFLSYAACSDFGAACEAFALSDGSWGSDDFRVVWRVFRKTLVRYPFAEQKYYSAQATLDRLAKLASLIRAQKGTRNRVPICFGNGCARQLPPDPISVVLYGSSQSAAVIRGLRDSLPDWQVCRTGGADVIERNAVIVGEPSIDDLEMLLQNAIRDGTRLVFLAPSAIAKKRIPKKTLVKRSEPPVAIGHLETLLHFSQIAVVRMYPSGHERGLEISPEPPEPKNRMRDPDRAVEKTAQRVESIIWQWHMGLQTRVPLPRKAPQIEFRKLPEAMQTQEWDMDL